MSVRSGFIENWQTLFSTTLAGLFRPKARKDIRFEYNFDKYSSLKFEHLKHFGFETMLIL